MCPRYVTALPEDPSSGPGTYIRCNAYNFSSKVLFLLPQAPALTRHTGIQPHRHTHINKIEMLNAVAFHDSQRFRSLRGSELIYWCCGSGAWPCPALHSSLSSILSYRACMFALSLSDFEQFFLSTSVFIKSFLTL